MRILFVTNQYPTDKTPGASPCIEQQKKSLEDLGFEVDVLFFNGPESRVNYLKAMWRVFWLIQVQKQYDLVHAHYGFCGIVARAQFRCPVVVTFRGSDVFSPRERPISRMVSASVDKIIVMTEEMRKVLYKHDVKVIPYGVDLDVFKPQPRLIARQKLGLSPTAPLILFPYNPHRVEKRFDLIDRTIAILEKEFPEVQLLVVYNKPYDSIVDYMNACDALVLASDSEGAPMAVREAMACNLPVVSVDVGDVVSVIRGTEGCYICSKSPDDIAAKLSKVLLERKRTNGYFVASQFGLAKSALEIAKIYEELLRRSIQ